MKRCLYSLAFLLVIARTAHAQLQSGSISGTTTDEQAAVLPGVTLTLHGVDVTQTFATDATGQYRFLNLAPGPYTVTAELQGFGTIVREHVMVEVGKNIELALQMKIAALAETITVEGGSPLIDTKQTSTSTNITSDELEKIPTSRDPFAIMRSVPGVLVDRVNVGGNETGQQSNFASKGTRPQDAVWTLDGIVITDQAATGASPTYFNFDNFEEIQVSTAGQNIKQPTGGLRMNLIVKRGTNQFHEMSAAISTTTLWNRPTYPPSSVRPGSPARPPTTTSGSRTTAASLEDRLSGITRGFTDRTPTRMSDSSDALTR